jgi:hypothetical protein
MALFMFYDSFIDFLLFVEALESGSSEERLATLQTDPRGFAVLFDMLVEGGEIVPLRPVVGIETTLHLRFGDGEATRHVFEPTAHVSQLLAAAMIVSQIEDESNLELMLNGKPILGSYCDREQVIFLFLIFEFVFKESSSV